MCPGNVTTARAWSSVRAAPTIAPAGCHEKGSGSGYRTDKYHHCARLVRSARGAHHRSCRLSHAGKALVQGARLPTWNMTWCSGL